MVEHTNAATGLPQSHSQSPNGSRHRRFSLLRWFRPRRREPGKSAKRRPRASSSSSDSACSLDSLYSTATVRSFAFHSGARKQAVDAALRLQSAAVGPFAPGAVKLAASGRVEAAAATTCTLPSGFTQARDLRTRYALHPAHAFVSYDNLPRPRGILDGPRNARGGAPTDAAGSGNNDTLTSLDSSTSGSRRVHVKGKRRAPEPPVERALGANAAGGANQARRKRRPAPKPPGHTDTLSSEASASGMDSALTAPGKDLSNDTLVLRRGVLHAKADANCSPDRSASASLCDSDSNSAVLTPKLGGMTPRPWYKRNVFGDHGSRERSTARRTTNDDLLRNFSAAQVVVAETRDDNLSSNSSSPTLSHPTSFPFEGSLSRLGFFRHHGDDKKKDSKRKSGVSILTNISELDKEAAAIVQEEQARNRTSTILQAAKLEREEFEKRMAANEKIVQEIVNSSLEKSPRRSAGTLIGKFNGLGNIPRFGVHSNFFSRQGSASPNARRYNRRVDEAERDLSRFFPAKRPPPPKMESATLFAEVINPGKRNSSAAQLGKVTRASDDNSDFAETLAKELDDVATGIARLRRELDDRPKLLENAAKPKDESTKKPSPASDQQLANFDKEFSKIFDEIDRQLRPRNSSVAVSVINNHGSSGASPSDSAEGTANVKKDDNNVSSASTKTKTCSEDVAKKEEPKTGVARISGVDDKTTNDLKEMLKEMKHSLPKQRPGAKAEAGKESAKPRINRPSTSGNAASAGGKASSAKVSSGVQTSGNVRRIVVKPGGNTYANVNAREQPRVKIDLRLADNAPTPLAADTASTAAAVAERPDKRHDDKSFEEIKEHCMNTLAVNRLLRKLEAAIASGNHQQAAVLAKELAQLKIHCSVVRQRSCDAKEKLKLSMYIEDKQAHQGPIPLQLPANMTVAQLKAKIQLEFEIPANVQRWIIGKNLADDDDVTLRDLQAAEGSAVFLYLVAPPDLQDKETIKEDKEREKQAGRVINEKNDEREIKAEIKPETVAAAAAAAAATAEASAAEPLPRQPNEDSLPRDEKLKRYEELMSLENCDVIITAEPIECPVCLMITVPGEGVTLRDCLHTFCRDCVINVVRYCEDAEVKCPYRDADYTCESTLQEREIKALVSAEVYQQHLAKSIAQAENSAGNNAFHCKTPDCPGWCIYDDDVNNFLCPVCKVNNCLTCQAAHMGRNCRQYQEELKYSKETDHESKRTAAMLEEMVCRGEALSCPTCAVVLMKKWGCDWLRCSMCKTEICWVTRGPRWGPGGKGDTSGGCKCGENGVKCHPKCNYCH
ncbi:uncharacterized protein LOC131665917 [Phymastichus coffea]|uniref:uncharacterized protein LOC131665917 n=1 Tax=Phymastichus coffea TaxID=108790 RepID=UPI00273B94F1|nr:uncharacterized protein LOC131665917 [Phymastichus coffea]